MRKTALALAIFMASALLCGCSKPIREYSDGLRPYFEMSDGSFMCERRSYKYRLEVRGEMPNSQADPPVETVFVWLSNVEDISFYRSWRAAGLSSFTGDYFSPEEALLVEWYSEER